MIIFFVVSDSWVVSGKYEIIPYIITGVIGGAWYKPVVELFNNNNLHVDYSQRGFFEENKSITWFEKQKRRIFSITGGGKELVELVLAKKKDLMRKITLVPIGGLGNRIEAISSVIAYCHAREIYLEVIWFKDHGLNCDFDNLFMINKSLKNIEIRNANIGDLFLRDNPRRRNFWIPFLFEYILYDKCIYCSKGDFKVQDIILSWILVSDLYKSIFMVSWGRLLGQVILFFNG